MIREVSMSALDFYSMLLSAFVLGFSLRTLVVWGNLWWRISRADIRIRRKHLAL